jgi:hypothetical protein
MQSSIKGKISFQSSTFHSLNKCSFHSKIAVADPTAIEERVAEASLVFGINSYRELCGLHLGGTTLTSADLLLRSTTNASKRAKFMVDKIKSTLAEDEALRAEGKTVDFTKCIQFDNTSSCAADSLPIQLKRFRIDATPKAEEPQGRPENSKMEVDSDEGNEEDSKNGKLKLKVFILEKTTVHLISFLRCHSVFVWRKSWCFVFKRRQKKQMDSGK